MRFILIVLAYLISSKVSAQTFYVNAKDPRSKEALEDKLRYEGYKLTDSLSADYVFNFLVDGEYKLTFKKTHKAYATITKGDAILVKSKEVKTNPAALNGYNASYGMAKMIANKQLKSMIDQIK
jgi:hypothetical protein